MNKSIDIEKRNNKFKKANKARKRVMIARDVLAQLGTRLLAKQGVWVSSEKLYKPFPNDTEVCDVTFGLKECQVCGIGALFVAAVEFGDNLKVGDLCDQSVYGFRNEIKFRESDVFGYLSRYFERAQLSLIENAFELGNGTRIGNGYKFFEGLDPMIITPEKRMRLIMENIIVNKGTFCPDKKPQLDYVTPGFNG